MEAVDRQIAAESLYEHLERSGFVIFVKRNPANDRLRPRGA
jgi:hypothetical protein